MCRGSSNICDRGRTTRDGLSGSRDKSSISNSSAMMRSWSRGAAPRIASQQAQRRYRTRFTFDGRRRSSIYNNKGRRNTRRVGLGAYLERRATLARERSSARNEAATKTSSRDEEEQRRGAEATSDKRPSSRALEYSSALASRNPQQDQSTLTLSSLSLVLIAWIV